MHYEPCFCIYNSCRIIEKVRHPVKSRFYTAHGTHVEAPQTGIFWESYIGSVP
jgi:hypothetical protein